MQLQHIKAQTCPICGTDIIIEERIEAFHNEIRKHALTGKTWEHRKFICGQELIHIPNYEDMVLSKCNVCTNNAEYRNAERKKAETKEELLAFIDTLDVSEDQKTTWQKAIY
jgi:hypothetical protein